VRPVWAPLQQGPRLLASLVRNKDIRGTRVLQKHKPARATVAAAVSVTR
jgi:hypothetical protein